MLYFAYGSNLNKSEMQHRCPHSKFVGVATVNGYSLEFRYYLSVKKSEDNIEVGVWDIAKEDLPCLDYYEGYPTLYRKTIVDGLMDGERIEGLIYIMNEDQIQLSPPSKDYYLRCKKGYEDCGMDRKQMDKLLFH